MIEDPEFRRMLEEELKVVREECGGLVMNDVETLHHKRRLKNREEEIERLLGLRLPNPDAIRKGQKRLRWLVFILACGIVLLACLSWGFQWRLSALEKAFERYEGALQGFTGQEAPGP